MRLTYVLSLGILSPEKGLKDVSPLTLHTFDGENLVAPPCIFSGSAEDFKRIMGEWTSKIVADLESESATLKAADEAAQGSLFEITE